MRRLRDWICPPTVFSGLSLSTCDAEVYTAYERRRRRRKQQPSPCAAPTTRAAAEPPLFSNPVDEPFAPPNDLGAGHSSSTATTPASASSFVSDEATDENAVSNDGMSVGGADDDDTDDSEDNSIDRLDPRILRRIEHFQRIPRLAPDLEFFFRYAGGVMLDCLLATLCTPLKVLLYPTTTNRRDVMAIFFTVVGMATFHFVGYPESSVLYSTLYHTVRTAAIIKLYLLFSILEVSDRLLTSLTGDSLEILYAAMGGYMGGLRRRWQRVNHSTTFAACPQRTVDDTMTASLGLVLGSLFLSTVAVALHSMVLLLHVVTLNVAINSEGNSLLALLISNNFMELKSVVFKKYVRESLLQVCCADALERVQLIIFVCCMLLQHLNTEGFGSIDTSDVVVVVACELLVDFVKHYFVATFNGVGLSLYRSFHQVLMFDVAADHFLWRLGADMPLTCEDPSVEEKTLRRLVSPSATFVPSAARRCGFVPMPYLAVLLWCLIPILCDFWARGRVVVMLLGVLVVLGLKSATHVYLVGTASRFTVRSLLISVSSSTLAASQRGNSKVDVGDERPCPDRRHTMVSSRTSTAVTPPSAGSQELLTAEKPRKWSLFSQRGAKPADLEAPQTTSSILGVSPQLTPMRAPKQRHVDNPFGRMLRSKSMPLLRSTASNMSCQVGVPEEERSSVIHISKILMSLIMTERFDINAGKVKNPSEAAL